MTLSYGLDYKKIKIKYLIVKHTENIFLFTLKNLFSFLDVRVKFGFKLYFIQILPNILIIAIYIGENNILNHIYRILGGSLPTKHICFFSLFPFSFSIHQKKKKNTASAIRLGIARSTS